MGGAGAPQALWDGASNLSCFPTPPLPAGTDFPERGAVEVTVDAVTGVQHIPLPIADGGAMSGARPAPGWVRAAPPRKGSGSYPLVPGGRGRNKRLGAEIPQNARTRQSAPGLRQKTCRGFLEFLLFPLIFHFQGKLCLLGTPILKGSSCKHPLSAWKPLPEHERIVPAWTSFPIPASTACWPCCRRSAAAITPVAAAFPAP